MLYPDHECNACIMHHLLFINFPCLQLIGDGAIAQVVTSGTSAGGFLTVNIGYGIALTIGLYVSIGISGGHLNPAVTLAMALRGKLSWLKVSLWATLHARNLPCIYIIAALIAV